MASVILNRLPCCGKPTQLDPKPYRTGRRCRPCQRSWHVTVTRSEAMTAKCGIDVYRATWEERAYRPQTD